MIVLFGSTLQPGHRCGQVQRRQPLSQLRHNVIGVTNTRRLRDLTPPATTDKERKEHPDAGGADAFLKFLTDELAPWVNTRYRTQPYRILVGHSLGGLFAVHALLTQPQSFQAYIAVSPSLWWDDRATVKHAMRTMEKIPAGRHYLRMTWGDNEAVIRDSTTELVEWLQARPPAGVQWSKHYYAGEDHGSTPHPSLYDGLRDLFAGWRPAFEIDDVEQSLDLAAIEAHYAALSQKYGYVIKPSADAINGVAEGLMKRKESTAALALLRRNVLDYPWRADVHANLGEALDELNRPEEAQLEFAEGLQLTIDNENPYGDPVASYLERASRKPRSR